MPMNLIQLAPIIATISETILYLRRKSLLPQNMIHCNQICWEHKDPSVSDGIRFVCRVCRKRIPIREGSIFRNSRLPLNTLLLLVYCFANRISMTETLKLLVNAVSHTTVVQWFSYLREIMSHWLLNNPIVLGGNNAIVQMDEALIGNKRKYNRGAARGLQQWVFGMLDTVTKQCVLRLVADRTGNTLLPYITQYCVQNCEIHTDQGAMYNSLPQYGFTHKTVCHKDEFVAIDGTHTNNIEGFWSHLKNHFKCMCGTNLASLPLHVDEYMYRHNRKNHGDVFDLLLQDIATQYPV